MAGAKLSATDSPTDKLLNKIADFIDADSVTAIAMDLDMGDSKLSHIMAEHPGSPKHQAFRVLKWWDYGHSPPDVQTLISKLREWKGSGYVDIDVMESIQGMVDMDLQLSQSSKILTNVHLRDISERICGDTDLMELGIRVLRVPGRKVDQARDHNRQNIQAASHEVLRFWLRQQVNREEAYRALYDGLWNNNWKMLANELKTWVEG